MSRAVAERPVSPLDRTLVRVRRGERVVLRQGKKAVAAVVSLDDLKRLQQLEDQEDIRDARAALKEARKKGTIPWEKVKAELGLRSPTDARRTGEICDLRAETDRLRRQRECITPDTAR